MIIVGTSFSTSVVSIKHFCPHGNKRPAFSSASGLKSGLEKFS